MLLPPGRELRHGLLLILFLLLLLLGLVVDNALDDDDDGAYAHDLREQRTGGIALTTLLHTPSYWRSTPLRLDGDIFPYVTDAFRRQFLTRTTPPQLADVCENRTRVSGDFYEELQLLRVPGAAAAAMARLVRAHLDTERRAARAVALAQRHYKPWHTRRTSATENYPPVAGAQQAKVEEEEEREEREKEYVEAWYTEAVLYYGMSSTAARAGMKSLGKGTRLAVSLESDDVQLVPYPFVPFVATAAEESATAARADQLTAQRGAKGDEAPAARGDVLVRIDKDKVKFRVPRRRTPHTPTHGWDHFYIALNLWRNEKVLPDLTEALAAFLEDEVKPFFDLATSVVVAIYANISPDRTAEKIESVLIPRLHALGVRVVYATTEGACMGYVERQPFHERIEWMACIRNKALEPLYEHGMRVFAPATSQAEKDEKNDAKEGGEELDDVPSADGLVVIFFNDIFFRPQDITTLLESRAEAQMDEDVRPHGWLTSLAATRSSSTRTTNRPAGGVVADTLGEEDMADGAAAKATAGATASPPSPSPSAPPPPPSHAMRGSTFDMACGMDFYYTFYDTWVTRDRLGNPFEAQMPYSDDPVTQAALYRIFNHDTGARRKPFTSASTTTTTTTTNAGEVERKGGVFSATNTAAAPETAAIPVKCCWNGVAAIRGRFFLSPQPPHRQLFPPHEQHHSEEKRRGTRSTAPSPREGAAAAALSAPRTIQRPSGALYDRIGGVDDVLDTTGMMAYYTRLLARRLQSERTAWNDTRAEIAKVTEHPFYQPTVYDNSSSFSALLGAVLMEQQQQNLRGICPGESWSSLLLPLNATATLNDKGTAARHPVDDARQQGRAAAAEDDNRNPGLPAGSTYVAVPDDSAFYSARYPAVRFRHAFTPSYGATVHGRKAVRDDVCLSSECLLICQDVMQAAVLQDQRAPLVLLNPHVRVAYDLDHFERVVRQSWFFEHPYVYWTWVLARRVQLWWLTGSTSGRPAAGGGAAVEAAEVRELGQATSATDDWLRATVPPDAEKQREEEEEEKKAGDRDGPHPVAAAAGEKHRLLFLEDGYGAVRDAGVVDVAVLTQMACQRITAGSIGLAIGAFFPLVRAAQLLVVALLLRWLCWSAQAGVSASSDVSSGDAGGHAPRLNTASSPSPPSSVPSRSLAPEELWWCAVYRAVWGTRLAQRARRAIDSLYTPDAAKSSRSSSTSSRYGGEEARLGSAGEAPGGDSEAVFMSRKAAHPTHGRGYAAEASVPLQNVPLLHLQLRQYYRRKKIAATIGSCAYKARASLRYVAQCVVWLAGSLCCVRWWCGCRTPPVPLPPAYCADACGGQAWDAAVVAMKGGATRSTTATAGAGAYASHVDPRWRLLGKAPLPSMVHHQASLTPSTAGAAAASAAAGSAPAASAMDGEDGGVFAAGDATRSRPSTPTVGVFYDGGEAGPLGRAPTTAVWSQQQQQQQPQCQQQQSLSSSSLLPQLRDRKSTAPWTARGGHSRTISPCPPPSSAGSPPPLHFDANYPPTPSSPSSLLFSAHNVSARTSTSQHHHGPQQQHEQQQLQQQQQLELPAMRVESPTSLLQRGDYPYGASGIGSFSGGSNGSAALQNVRPRNVYGRSGTAAQPGRSPTTPGYGFPGTGRPSDGTAYEVDV